MEATGSTEPFSSFSYIIEIATAGFKTKILETAAKLKVFDAVEAVSMETGRAAQAMEVARHSGWDLEGTRRLLDAIVTLRLLQKEPGSAGGYSNTSDLKRYLLAGSEESLVPFVDMWASFEPVPELSLSDFVTVGQDAIVKKQEAKGKAGSDFDDIIRDQDLERSAFFQRGMSALAPCTPLATSQLDLSRYKNVVDLGGGFGSKTRHLLDQYPNMTITVVELPVVVEAAQKHSRPLERMTFVHDDFFKGGLPKADLYILSNIIHDWTDNQGDVILANVNAALDTGDSVLLLERLRDDDCRNDHLAGLMDIKMALHTRGRERRLDEYTAMLEKAKFKVREVVRLPVEIYTFFDAILADKVSD